MSSSDSGFRITTCNTLDLGLYIPCFAAPVVYNCLFFLLLYRFSMHVIIIIIIILSFSVVEQGIKTLIVHNLNDLLYFGIWSAIGTLHYILYNYVLSSLLICNASLRIYIIPDNIVICSFCGGEFNSLGRHPWRCKEKLKYDNNSEAESNSRRIYANSPLHPNCKNSTHVSNCSEVSCCCEKVCNGLRGLKMHQRSCRVLKGLDQETFDSVDVNETYDDTQGRIQTFSTFSLENIRYSIITNIPHILEHPLNCIWNFFA